MSYIIIPPCAELKDYVKHFWMRKWHHSTYFSHASTCIEFSFGLELLPNNQSGILFSLIKGQTDIFGQYPSNGSYDMIGVSLYPYAIPFLFNIPVFELNNRLIQLDELLKQDSEMINEKISSTSTIHERIRIITDYFRVLVTKRHFEDRRVIHAVKQIRETSGNLSICDLSSKSYLSQKQFVRRFREYAGFTPRLYAKIVRFETALFSTTLENNLTEAAHKHGYFDQSHFIRDFKRFSGFSPREYFSLVQR